MRFIEKVKRLLKRGDLTQKSLAARLGTSPEQVTRWLRPKVRPVYPTPAQLVTMARLFRVSVEFLCDDAKGFAADLEVDREERLLLRKARLLGSDLARERLEADPGLPRFAADDDDDEVPARPVRPRKKKKA